MALEAGSVDPSAVSTILNRLKSQGIFDQFRRDCLADVDTKPAYQNLRQRVESFVSNFLSRSRWTPEMNKNQLRDRLRRQINQSDMLASGVDRIIEQVVEPKMQYVFRPHIERIVSQYLHSDTLNGMDGGMNMGTNGGTVLPLEYPLAGIGDAQPMTPPDESTGPKVPTPPLDHPPLPPALTVGDNKKMPPPPQPPPPPLPMEQLSVNIDNDPAILPSPAFEPIGSSPPHPGATYSKKPIVESPMPEALSDGSPEQMDISLSPEADPLEAEPESTEVTTLLAKSVLAKTVVVDSPAIERVSPIPKEGEISSVTKDMKRGILKRPAIAEKAASSPKPKLPETMRVASATSSPGSVKSIGASQNIKRDKAGDSPGLPSSAPSTPEKAQKTEYERKLEIQRKVENLIKQNIKIGDKRDNSDSSSDGGSSPDIRFRGGGSSDRRRFTPNPERHRVDRRDHERKKPRMRPQETPPTKVRPEDALRAISPEVISDEELEKRSPRGVGSGGERSEGEVVSSEEGEERKGDVPVEPMDLGNLSDITVSSVHTSDLSSFSDVSSSSSTSGSDAEDDRKKKESSGATTNLKLIAKTKDHKGKPKGIPHHPDSSEDEATREERRKKAALAKEERAKKRQQEREEKSKTTSTGEKLPQELQQTEKSKIDEDLSPVSTDTDSNKEDDSPEPKDVPAAADSAAKPVAKRRVSEEEKPLVAVFPSFSSSLSTKLRRLATVRESFLLTQRISGKNLLKRKKKKMNNRSGSKLFFRMGGAQSGGNTPKRSASPRMGKPTMPRPEGHQLVSAAVDRLKASGVGGGGLPPRGSPAKSEDVVIFGKVESQDIGTVHQGQFIPLESDRDTEIAGMKDEDSLQAGGNPQTAGKPALGPSPWNEERKVSEKSKKKKDREASKPHRKSKAKELTKVEQEGGQKSLWGKDLSIIGDQLQKDEAETVEEVVVTTEEHTREENSSGPATPLMDEPSDEDEMDVDGSEPRNTDSDSLVSKEKTVRGVSADTLTSRIDDISSDEEESSVKERLQPAFENVSDEEEGGSGQNKVDTLKPVIEEVSEGEDEDFTKAVDSDRRAKIKRTSDITEAGTGHRDGMADTADKSLGHSLTGVEEVSDDEVDEGEIISDAEPEMSTALESKLRDETKTAEMPDRAMDTNSKSEETPGIGLIENESEGGKRILEGVEDVSDGEEVEELERIVLDESVVSIDLSEGQMHSEIVTDMTEVAVEDISDGEVSGDSLEKGKEDAVKKWTDLSDVSDSSEHEHVDKNDVKIHGFFPNETDKGDIPNDQPALGEGPAVASVTTNSSAGHQESFSAKDSDQQKADGGRGHKDEPEPGCERDAERLTASDGQQTCKVILEHVQRTPELKDEDKQDLFSPKDKEGLSSPGDKEGLSSPEDKEALSSPETPKMMDTLEDQCSWVEEIEDGVVQVYDVTEETAVEKEEGEYEDDDDDNPPTPTQDEPVADDGVVIIGEGGSVQEEEVAAVASPQTVLPPDDNVGDNSVVTESEVTEEIVRSEDIHSEEVAQEVSPEFAQEANAGPESSAISGRRSRRSVSDRHSKDEDFVYFGVKVKSRPRSQSPTPSLQSNESESSQTSRSSARSSRRNSSARCGTDPEDKRPADHQHVTRKRHASQEQPPPLAEERPKRARRGSPPSRYSPSESVTQRITTKRKHSPPPQPPPSAQPHPPPSSQVPGARRTTSKREPSTRHSTAPKRDSDFVYDLPKRRSDRHSLDEQRPAKKKR